MSGGSPNVQKNLRGPNQGEEGGNGTGGGSDKKNGSKI